MRINEETKSMEIEARDVNYLLPAYVRMYLFKTRNQDPVRVVFPMFRTIPHPYKKDVQIPVEYVPDDSPIAVEIAHDGTTVPEATPASEAAADKKETDYDAMKKKLDELEAENNRLKSIQPTEVPLPSTPTLNSESSSAIAGVDSTHQPTIGRVARAKQPASPIPPGQPSDYGSGRNAVKDAKQMAKELAPGKGGDDVDESREKIDDELVNRVKGKK